MKTHFYLLLLLTWATNTAAQKSVIKFVQHQKYVVAEGGALKLSFQIEQSYNRFGNMVKQEYFYPKAGTGQLQADRKILHSFDTRGRHLGSMEYNGDNILETETKVYWDEQDNRSKVEEIRYSDGELTSNLTTYLLQYDERGNKKQEIYYSNDGTQEKIRQWFYNANDEVVKSVQLFEKKNQPKKKNLQVYKRNKNGDLEKAVSTEIVNGKQYRKDVQFFSNNQVVRWRKYINGKFESEFINEYRDSVVIRTTKRNTRKVISLEQAQREQAKMQRKANKSKKSNKRNSEIWVTNSEYDAYGNVAITTQSMNNKVVFVSQFEYDDYGNCTRSLKINKETNEKEEELIEFERMGNVSRRTYYKNGEILYEERFLYEYHPRD
jgi:hypothetical protein